MIGRTLVKSLFFIIIVLFVLTIFSGKHERDGQQEQFIGQQNARETTQVIVASRTNMHMARLNNAASSLDRFKRSVIRYRDYEKRWPESISDMGAISKNTANYFMDDVRVDNGQIYGFLKPEFGARKIIRVYPSQDTYPYKWKCSTNLDLGDETTLGGMECTEDPNISYTGSYF